MARRRSSHRRHRRKSSSMQVPGLNTVKMIGNKSVSGVKKGFSGIFDFLKSGVGLATNTVKQGVKVGTSVFSKTRKHRRRHRR